MIDTTKQRFKYRHRVPQADTTNAEFAYWIGFLLADGCISEQLIGSDRLIVGLNKRDRGHLVRLRKWLGSNHPIVNRPKYNSVELRIRSQKLCDMLRDFGITPRKSLTAIPDGRLINNRHFWRGMIDGDGTVFIDGRDKLFTMGLIGTYDVCKRFWQYCLRIDSSFRDVSVCKTSWNGWSLRFCGRKAEKIAAELYQDGDTALSRKMKIMEVNRG